MKPNIDKLDYSELDIFYKWLTDNKIGDNEPYCLQWKNKNKILNYIGTIHTFNEKNPTTILMDNIIKNYKPDIVIIEGINNEKGINPELPRRIKNTEMEHLALLCQKNKIDFIGIETKDNEVYDIIKEKYNIDDIYGYLFLLHHRLKYKKINKNDFIEDFYNRILINYKTFIKNIDWNHKTWFKKTFGKNFTYGKYIKYSEPSNNKKALITQKLSFDWHKIRDIFNIYTLYKYLNKYNNVVYSMGRNHAFIDRNVISKDFGTMTILNHQSFYKS